MKFKNHRNTATILALLWATYGALELAYSREKQSEKFYDSSPTVVTYVFDNRILVGNNSSKVVN